MLDVRWLEDLIAIAETRSLTKAAELRHMTQPGLSRRVQSLEHWAGAPLLDRRKSPIDLTDAGYRLLGVAGEVLGRLNGARHAIREEQDERLRSVRFAAPHILSVTFFPKWLPAIQARLGPTRVTILSDNLPGCCAALEEESVDFVICLVDPDGGVIAGPGRPLGIEGYEALPIGREKLIALSAPDATGGPRHSLQGGGREPISYLGYSRECSLGWAVERKLGMTAGLPPLDNFYENSLADGLRTMALAGLGVAWLPLTTTHTDILRGRLVRAASPATDIGLDVKLFRAPRKASRKGEELWMRLSVECAVMTCPEMPEPAPAHAAR